MIFLGGTLWYLGNFSAIFQLNLRLDFQASLLRNRSPICFPGTSFFPAGEQEEAWLQEAGLATLVQEVGDIGAMAPSLGSKTGCVDDGMVLLSTLTRGQAAAVLRRLDTYNQTVRKKSRPVTRDVREIFPSTDVTARPVSIGCSTNLFAVIRFWMTPIILEILDDVGFPLYTLLKIIFRGRIFFFLK